MELASDQITSNMDSRLAQDVGGLRANFPFIGDIDPAGNILNNKQGTKLFFFTCAIHFIKKILLECLFKTNYSQKRQRK